MMKKKVISALIQAVFILSAGCSTQPDPEKELLKITFLKVGKADAIIAQKGEKVMVIDTGEEDDGEEVVSFLKEEQIDQVDYLIITHYDRDHVGGADTLLENIDVKTILLPDYESVSSEYLDFMDAVRKNGKEPVFVNETYTFDFAGCEVNTEPPQSYAFDPLTDYDNNLSLIISLTYDEHRFVFTGDIEKQRIREWVESCPGTYTFMKFPHHGVYNAALEEMLEETKPEMTVICDSAKHPAEEKTLALLDRYGVSVRETKNGDVIVLSDGKKIEMKQ